MQKRKSTKPMLKLKNGLHVIRVAFLTWSSMRPCRSSKMACSGASSRQLAPLPVWHSGRQHGGHQREFEMLQFVRSSMPAIGFAVPKSKIRYHEALGFCSVIAFISECSLAQMYSRTGLRTEHCQVVFFSLRAGFYPICTLHENMWHAFEILPEWPFRR